eukprot:TRINITY_DN87_c0_g1_i2.p2 TRINITY_DN87_c0_g1~~TRINITY_DN87_c0_g1_i2.p2  ORF type:complete len:592 (-),score=175.38 TRINITY_DN87_c0_g1_i2:769-2544(-)
MRKRRGGNRRQSGFSTAEDRVWDRSFDCVEYGSSCRCSPNHPNRCRAQRVTDMESKKFLTAEEVAAEFGLDAATLQQFVDAGDVRALADRGTWKYRRDELQALVDAGKISSTSLSDGDQILTFDNSEDDLSYIELDETALAEQATMITKSQPEEEAPADWFVPSDATNMESPVEPTSSDVAIYTGPGSKSTGETPVLAEASDSDVQIAPDYQAAAAAEVVQAESDETVWDDLAAEASESHESDSSVRLADDSDVQLMGLASGTLRTPAEDSGIMLEDSQVGLPDESKPDSGIALDLGAHDSGIALDTAPADSGIALDTGANDSGITLDSGNDSGISLDHADSGISLGHADSGLALSNESGISFGADSGLSLGGDSGLSLEGSGNARGNAKTLADMDLSDDDNDRTQTLNLMGEEDDSSFEINLDDGDATAELLLGDDDDLDDTSATVVRKGRSSAGSLSAAFDLDEETEVEDLEISEDLDAGSEAEVEEFDADDEVFDASDETFSGDEVEAVIGDDEEEEDYLEPAAKAKKATGPKEPAWGAGMAVGLVACTLFMAVNTLIIWTGVSSMWSGDEAEAPGGALVQTFGDLIK